MNIVGYKSPFKKKSSPMKLDPVTTQIAMAAAPGVISAIGSLFGRRQRRREQRAAAEEMRAAKQAFMNIEYVNPYADLKNPYDNMENVYEDLTVNTQAADYLRQQQQQSQADIMQNLRGAAGGSGVAGLAQSIANISSAQAQQASAQIAQQEGRNQLLEAREKGRLQQLQRTGEFGVEKLKMQGEALRRKQEEARTQALFGLSIDRKMAADKARQQARSQFFAGVGQAAAGVAGLYAPGGSLYGTGNPFATPPRQLTTHTGTEFNTFFDPQTGSPMNPADPFIGPMQQNSLPYTTTPQNTTTPQTGSPVPAGGTTDTRPDFGYESSYGTWIWGKQGARDPGYQTWLESKKR